MFWVWSLIYDVSLAVIGAGVNLYWAARGYGFLLKPVWVNPLDWIDCKDEDV
ncbi:hypothetical protein D3C81_2259750 [compost metagenome]